jgi:hypothetical protein
MADPTRQEALATLRNGQARIDGLLTGLSEEQLTKPATMGDGDWSAKDLIGHLASWEELALQALQEFRAGKVPWVESPEGPFSGTGTTQVDAFNARVVAKKQQQSLEAVRREAKDVHHRLLECIERMSDDEWTSKAFYQTPTGRRRKVCTLLGSILAAPPQPFGHAFAHVPDLEAFAASLGP